MVRVESRNADNFISGGVVLLLLASLPLVALIVLVLRGMLLAAGVAAVVFGVIAYAISPAFREWFKAHSEPLVGYKGLQLATDVVCHPSHSWARMQGDVVVGADDLMQAALGPVEVVELPPAGREVRQGERLFRLRRGARSVDVRSPVTGTVLVANPQLRGRPELVNEDPFGKGWAVRLRSVSPREDRRGLMRGDKARAWFHVEVDRAIALLSARMAPAVLADGGVVMGELHEHIDDATWRQLAGTMFGQEPA